MKNVYKKLIAVWLMVGQIAVAGGAGSTMSNAPQQQPADVQQDQRPELIATADAKARRVFERREAARKAWETEAARKEEAARKAKSQRHEKAQQSKRQSSASVAQLDQERKRVAQIEHQEDQSSVEIKPAQVAKNESECEEELSAAVINALRKEHNEALGKTTKMLSRTIKVSDRKLVQEQPKEELFTDWVDEVAEERAAAQEKERLANLPRQTERALAAMNRLAAPKKAT